MKRRTNHEQALVVRIRDALRLDPALDRTALARALDCHKCTVFRVANEMAAGVAATTVRCKACGRRLHVPHCLACDLLKN
jgi:transcription elongation factor Elf1